MKSHRLASLVFVGLLLTNYSCAQPKDVKQLQPSPSLRSRRRLLLPSDWASERPHFWDGLILAGNCRGDLQTFRASDGAPQWKLNLKGCIRSIGSSEKRAFVGVQEGTIYAYELSLSQ